MRPKVVVAAAAAVVVVVVDAADVVIDAVVADECIFLQLKSSNNIRNIIFSSSEKEMQLDEKKWS